jgi:hypothetical protein
MFFQLFSAQISPRSLKHYEVSVCGDGCNTLLIQQVADPLPGFCWNTQNMEDATTERQTNSTLARVEGQ